LFAGVFGVGVAGVVGVEVEVRLTNSVCGWTVALVGCPGPGFGLAEDRVPTVPITFVIRSGVGRKTAAPSFSEPVVFAPRCACSLFSASVVCEPK
jgi:hypothetical protein